MQLGAGLALLFPGQASQHVGMGVALRRASKRADDIFRLADEIAQLPIGALCADGPLEELTQTDVAQMAVVTTSLAVLAAIEEVIGRPIDAAAVGGHSVGELAAMCAAGALTIEATLRLVRERGRLMRRDAEACHGTMVAVLGLSGAELDPICREASSTEDGHVQVANLNAPGQVILSGDRAAIARASEAARTAGARRVMPLAVGGPFHSRYMGDAAASFARIAETVAIGPPRVPVVLNASAAPSIDTDTFRDELSVQITSPVRWEESIRRMASMGCTTFLELGPGEVLTGMTKRIEPAARALAIGTPEAIGEAIAAMSTAQGNRP